MTSNPRLQMEPTDVAVRALILDPTRSFLVQAPAGSGKTELLMQRYLTLLAHPSVSTPENVLAITFTKKAATEMRNRVLEALQQAAQEAPAEQHKRLSWDLAQKVAQRNRQLGWNLLDNPERLEIRTVDSFCEKIANRTPLLAGLGQSSSIAADFAPLYAEAARRTLMMLGDAGDASSAIGRVLSDQDNRLEHVQQLLAQLLERREQWLSILGRSDVHSFADETALRTALETSLRDAVESELRKIRTTVERLLPKDVITELLSHARYAANNLLDPENATIALRDLHSLPGTKAEDRRLWHGLRMLCLTGNDTFRKKFDKGCGFPDRRQATRCKDLLDEIASAEHASELCVALTRVDDLPPASYSNSNWQSLRALFHVLPRAVAHLRVVFAERGEVDHSEVAMAAASALGERGHPTDLAFHLGYKIQHLLVDEFQDTSVAQTELLERLIQAWSPETGATLFVVGDPMQSIYGFRQAEVALFLRARENGFGEGEWPLQAETLRSNFRSRPELVNWFNSTFPKILTAEDEVTGAVRYEYAEAARDASRESRVEYHAVSDKAYEAEADRVVAIVRDELARGARSIAVLVRSRSHLADIAPALQAAQIPFRAKDIHRLGERQTVRDLHAITQALLHPADRTAWLALLRGPWCGLSLADLWELCRGDRKTTIWELLRSRAVRLSPRAQEVLERLVPVLAWAIEQRGRMSLSALVRSVWVSIGGPAALAGAERAAKVRDADAFFELLQRLGDRGEVSGQSLNRELNKLFAPPDAHADIRVELMTIHAAKGLEFDVVILPGLSRRTEQNKKQLLNWRERVVGDRRDLLLAPMEPVAEKKDATTTIAKYIVRLGNECAAEENKRLLYVAATRAKERLHLVTTLPEAGKTPEKGSTLSLLPPEVLARFPQPDGSDLVGVERRRAAKLRRLSSSWKVPAAPEALHVADRPLQLRPSEIRKHTFVRVGEDLRRIGTVTHRVLQQIGEEGIEVWSAGRIATLSPVIRALLVQEGIREADLASAERRIRKALEHTLADPNGRWILQKRAAANNEYALSALVGNERHGIKVDRTFIDGETRWLIDYKTSDLEGTITDRYLQEQIDKYREDLARYATILRNFDGRTVKGGLYFPLLQRWCPIELPS